MTAGTHSDPTAPVPMDKRARLVVERVAGERNRVVDASARVVWYDARGLSAPQAQAIVPRLRRLRYTGIVSTAAAIEEASRAAGPAVVPVVAIERREELDGLVARS